GETVLDPFLGTGTTMQAAIASGRHSVGYEVDTAFAPMIGQGCQSAIEPGRHRIGDRFDAHRQFVHDRQAAGKAIKHTNRVYGFPVITRQEVELMIPLPAEIQATADNQYQVTYDMPEATATDRPTPLPKASPDPQPGQLALFD
ncbi:MAG: DNA methyltransferase, partial [Desulfosarcina sp.]